MEDGSPDREVIFEEDVWEIEDEDEDEDEERPPEEGPQYNTLCSCRHCSVLQICRRRWKAWGLMGRKRKRRKWSLEMMLQLYSRDMQVQGFLTVYCRWLDPHAKREGMTSENI